MPNYWILKDRVPVSTDWLTHVTFFRDDANRRVAETLLPDVRISTVFLGIDHNFARGGRPILFETMVFDGDGDIERQERYATWDEAEAGHNAIVAEECGLRLISIPTQAAPRVPSLTAWERLQRDDDDF